MMAVTLQWLVLSGLDVKVSNRNEGVVVLEADLRVKEHLHLSKVVRLSMPRVGKWALN